MLGQRAPSRKPSPKAHLDAASHGPMVRVVEPKVFKLEVPAILLSHDVLQRRREAEKESIELELFHELLVSAQVHVRIRRYC